MRAIKSSESKILKTNERAGKISGCIRFDKGSGNFPSIPAFKKAISALTGEFKNKYHGYAPSQGLWELREQIGKLELHTTRRTISPEQVLITHGALHGISLALTELGKPGDEVLINKIHFEGFKSAISSNGLTVKVCDFSNTVSVKKAITKKTRAIILNSPENPTGKVYSSREVWALVKIARQRNLWIISDEVNNQLVYKGFNTYSLPLNKHDKIIIVNSFSKNYFLQGLRIGWLIAAPELVQKFTARLTHQTICANFFGQRAGLEMLKRLPEQKLPDNYIHILKKRRDLLISILKDAGFRIDIPAGGTNIFMDTGMDSDSFANNLLKKHRVAVIPGNCFGEAAKNYIRIGFGGVTMKDIQQGCKKIIKAKQELSKKRACII